MMEHLLLAAALPVANPAGTAIDPQRWAVLEPQIKAALECRQPLKASQLQGVATPGDNPDSWKLQPPVSFTVFGLPVARVEIYIDSSDELGASYTAIIENHSLKKVEQQLKKVKKTTALGEIMASQAWGPHQVEVTCTLFEV